MAMPTSPVLLAVTVVPAATEIVTDVAEVYALIVATNVAELAPAP